jgi:hypothetical protein
VSHFPNPIAPYKPRYLSAPNLSNTARIDQLMHDGKLYLSLNDAIALALENNLDIAIARYNLNIADTDILRAKAGAVTLGVNSGIVQNTPGGGVGGLGGQVGSGTGGTTLGAGGAGAGAGGLVGSTLGLGPQITSFDPIVTGTLQSDRYHILPTSTFSPASPHVSTRVRLGYEYAGGFQQHPCYDRECPLQPAKSTAQLQFQVSTNAAPASRIWIRRQYSLHSDRQEQS